MREIPEDIILEILSFLPLKLLVRFKHLNKRLEQIISAPTFQNRRAVLRSFTGYECIFYKVTPSVRSTYLTVELPSRPYSFVLNSCLYDYMPIILASSGGLLLLYLFVALKEEEIWPSCRSRRIFCLFNPATGAYQMIPTFSHHFIGYGLVLNVVVSKNHFSYKLVLLCCSGHADHHCNFWIYESESNSWHEARTNLKSSWMLDLRLKHKEAYYLNDSLYWLEFGGYKGKIWVFNVKTDVSETISLPEALPKTLPEPNVNFGSIRDKLALMTEESNKVLLWIYDPIHHTWKIDRIFENNISSSWIFPVFCDGNQLILANFFNENKEACIVGIRDNSTEKIVTIPMWSYYFSVFTHFLATPTEIPSCEYLINGLKGMKEHISDDEFVLKRHFEDLLFITKCSSFLE